MLLYIVFLSIFILHILWIVLLCDLRQVQACCVLLFTYYTSKYDFFLCNVILLHIILASMALKPYPSLLKKSS